MTTAPTAATIELIKTHEGDILCNGKINSRVHEKMSLIPRLRRDSEKN